MGVPDLEDCQRQFQQIAEGVGALALGLTEAQFTWRPRQEAWSIQECFGHLTIVGQQYLRLIDNAIHEARVRRITGNGPFHYGWLERTFLRENEPPVRRRVPAPRRFRPVHGQPVTAILPTLLHVQREFIRLAELAKGLDLARVKVRSPISRFIKFSLGITLAQQAAHERRHLEQARQVRENPAFPAK